MSRNNGRGTAGRRDLEGSVENISVDIRSEFEGADLGDRRLEKRLLKVAEAVGRSPGASFPKAAESEAELEAMYRFFSNESASLEAILVPHQVATVARASSSTGVLVVHDTTEVAFGGERKRKGLGELTQNRQGFLAHFSLCIEAAEHLPLGALDLQIVTRTPKPRRSRSKQTLDSRKKTREEKESSRWEQGAISSSEVLGKIPTVHVMDQEADDFEVFATLQREGLRFVIRAGSDRLLDAVLNGNSSNFAEALEGKATQYLRTVRIQSRSKNRSATAKRAHPPRLERDAELHVRSGTVTLKRPQYSKNETKLVRLNLVQVFEPNPPPDQPAVEWTLLTTEPIETEKQLRTIVDIYCARWIIEEYFKALKTGCAIEERQLESAQALLNALAILSVAAWKLLSLRTLTRTAPDTPASVLFDDEQIELMRALGSERPRARLPNGMPTVRDFLLALAGLGGHLKRNGDPGWLVLWRGLEFFSAAEAAWRLAKKGAKK